VRQMSHKRNIIEQPEPCTTYRLFLQVQPPVRKRSRDPVDGTSLGGEARGSGEGSLL
jgi:hypothetical protein